MARGSRRALLAAAIACGGCGGTTDVMSSAGTSGGPTGGTAAGAGAPAGGSGGAAPMTGGQGGGMAGMAGASGRSAGSGGAAGMAGTGGGSGFSQVSVCGQRGQSMVNASMFEGYEEYFIISEEGFGEDICVVRFDVRRVGEAPAGCDDPAADVDCLWTHLVEFSNPMVLTDTDGVCADSELGLDQAAIDEIDGSRAAYGFVSEFAGHNSVLMKYDDAMAKWDAYGNATWDEGASFFRFDNRDGLCGY
jgi:hypothetical protein